MAEFCSFPSLRRWGDRVSSSVSNLFHPVNISALIVKSDLTQTALSAGCFMSFHVGLSENRVYSQ